MITMLAHIEIFADNAWHLAATLRASSEEAVAKGIGGGCWFEYDQAYVIDRMQQGKLTGRSAVSVRHPVSLELSHGDHWPAFLLDLLPGGHARRFWLNRLEPSQADGPGADWALLLQGGGNPPGNLRIREAADQITHRTHPGFALEDILERREHFVDYAEQAGASVAGSSGAQGDAPKFLLVRDHHDRWHADGAIADAKIADHWLIKLPRGPRNSDRQILRNEAAYMATARKVGLTLHEALPIWRENTLFIPRFDRRATPRGVERSGLESLLSAAGVAEFGAKRNHEHFCADLARYSSKPREDLLEYLRRDALNFALGNTDNHGRNQALLKMPDGSVRLSPLYDFAPMFLDEQGIARATRWDRSLEEPGSCPDWGAICDYLAHSHAIEGLRHALSEWADRFDQLPRLMADCGVDEEIIALRRSRIDATSRALPQC